MDKHHRFSLILASLGCALLMGTVVAGPRKAPTGTRGQGVAKRAVGKVNYLDWSGWKTPQVALEMKITRGNARHVRGETLIAAAFEPQQAYVGETAFTRGVGIKVPELGTVSPLSATLWHIVKMPPVKTLSHGSINFAHSQKGPLRLPLSQDVVEKMDELGKINPKLTRTQQLQHIIHENDQGDVYKTLSKLGYNPDSLKVDYEHMVYHIDHFLVVSKQSQAKETKAKNDEND